MSADLGCVQFVWPPVVKLPVMLEISSRGDLCGDCDTAAPRESLLSTSRPPFVRCDGPYTEVYVLFVDVVVF